MMASGFVKFSPLNSAKDEDDLGLIESEYPPDKEELTESRLEFSYPKPTTNTVVAPSSSQQIQNGVKAPTFEQSRRLNNRRIKALVITLAFLIILLVIIVWHFNHLEHVLEIKDKYETVARFNFKTRQLSVLDNKGNEAVSLLLDTDQTVSGHIQHLHMCNQPTADSACLTWTQRNTSLSITAFRFGDSDDVDKMHCVKVQWNMSQSGTPLDCVELTQSGIPEAEQPVWFGSHVYRVYPRSDVQKDPCDDTRIPYTPGGFSIKTSKTVLKNQGGNVIEPMWISSKGVAVKVSTHHTALVAQQICRGDPRICITSKPDNFHQEEHHHGDEEEGFHLDYMICVGDTLAAAHQETMEHFVKPVTESHEVPVQFQDMINDGAYFEGGIEKQILTDTAPMQLPSITLTESCSSILTLPLWDIVLPRQNNLLTSAYLSVLQPIGGTLHLGSIDGIYKRVGDYALTNSTLDFVRTAHDLNFKVMLPVTPFVNYDAKSFTTVANRKLVIFDDEVPALTRVTIGNQTLFPAVLDFTNPPAAEWFRREMRNFHSQSKVDYFHFYYGQSSWMPEHHHLSYPLHNPAHFSTLCTDVAYSVGRCTFTDVAYDSQSRHQFLRLSPALTLNGTLSAVLAAGLSGYPFVVPAYPFHGQQLVMSADQLQETLIRWIEMVSFFPVMHIPWDYNVMNKTGVDVSEVTTIIKKYLSLRQDSKVGAKIRKAILEAETNGTKPVVAPMWMAPDVMSRRSGADRRKIVMLEDQFMVGPDLFVAPLLVVGTKERSIFVPPGKWKDVINNKLLTGGTWIKKYSANLDQIPYFIRV